MKHFLALTIWSSLIFLVSFLGQWILGIFCAAIVIPIFRPGAIASVTLGFVSGFLVWGIMALVLDIANGHQLSGMIGSLLSIKSSLILVLITASLGGIGVALSGWVVHNLLSAKI